MEGEQVLAVLDLLESAQVDAWIDGGWGVDALIGAQTRQHQDLDLVIYAEAIGRAIDALGAEGFHVVRDWRPTALAFGHPDGREVDLHPVERTGDGGGDQIQRDGTTRWHYSPPVHGMIGRRAVRCCDLETQIASHLAYEPDDDDRADMRALAEHFACPLPEPYSDLVERDNID